MANIETGKTEAFLKGKLREEITELRFLTEDKLLIMSRHKALIWTISTGKRDWLAENEDRCFAIGKNGESIIYYHGEDGTFRIRKIDDADGKSVEKFDRLKFWETRFPGVGKVVVEEAFSDFSFSSDWSRFLTYGENAPTLWDVTTGKQLQFARDFDRRVESAAVSNDGASVAIGTGDGDVELMSVADGKTTRVDTEKGERVDVSALAFSKDDELLAVGRWDHSLKILTLKKDKQ